MQLRKILPYLGYATDIRGVTIAVWGRVAPHPEIVFTRPEGVLSEEKMPFKGKSQHSKGNRDFISRRPIFIIILTFPQFI